MFPVQLNYVDEDDNPKKKVKTTPGLYAFKQYKKLIPTPYILIIHKKNEKYIDRFTKVKVFDITKDNVHSTTINIRTKEETIKPEFSIQNVSDQ